MHRTEILLAEYAEAGQGCRAHEQYVRATLSMYLALAAAIAGLMVAVDIPAAVVRTYICLAASGVGWCMVLLVLRHRKIYAALADRAREIEAELGVSLYTQAKTKISGDEPTAKTLSAFIIGLIAVLFLVAAVVFAFKT